MTKSQNDYYRSYTETFTRLMNDAEATGPGGAPMPQEDALADLCACTSVLKENRGKMFFCGNGASAAFASHMALDWSKNGGIPAFALNDAVQLTALGNDIGYDEVFSVPLRWHAAAGDLLVVISSSGNSPNVVRAIEAADELGMRIVTFTGLKPDNASRSRGGVNFFIPAKTYGMVECAHQLILHAWLDRSMDVTEWDRDEVQNMRADDFRL